MVENRTIEKVKEELYVAKLNVARLENELKELESVNVIKGLSSNGIYRIYWKDGGNSLSSVGTMSDGRRWYCPCNWTGYYKECLASFNWDIVKYVERLYV